MLKRIVQLSFIGLMLSVTTQSFGQSLPPDPRVLAGDWVMHLYIGEKLFDDLLNVSVDRQSNVSGTLTVPNAFSAPLEQIEVYNGGFRFEIVADEGNGPFRVKYAASWNAERDAFVGFARISFNQGPYEFLGGFVGQKKIAGRTQL